jgi:hypothetical protein
LTSAGLSAENTSKPAPIGVETIWLERPSTLAAGAELAGCITYGISTREDVTKDEWVMDAITFQRGMHDAIYLDMVGNPQLLETDDCVIVQLTEPITFQVSGLDYTGLGKAELIEVTSLGEYSLRKRK